MGSKPWKAKRLRKARKLLQRKCGAWSSGLMGYQCELRYHHRGQHEAVIARTTTTSYRGTCESGRMTRRWT